MVVMLLRPFLARNVHTVVRLVSQKVRLSNVTCVEYGFTLYVRVFQMNYMISSMMCVQMLVACHIIVRLIIATAVLNNLFMPTTPTLTSRSTSLFKEHYKLNKLIYTG